MMIHTTEHCYVVRDDQILSGEPVIKGTRTPYEIVNRLVQLLNEVTADEMQNQVRYI